jgi:hypothetical protein
VPSGIILWNPDGVAHRGREGKRTIEWLNSNLDAFPSQELLLVSADITRVWMRLSRLFCPHIGVGRVSKLIRPIKTSRPNESVTKSGDVSI